MHPKWRGFCWRFRPNLPIKRVPKELPANTARVEQPAVIRYVRKNGKFVPVEK